MAMDDIARNIVHKFMRDESQSRILNEYLTKMNQGFYPKEDVDFVVQKWIGRGRAFDIYDAYFFSQFHTLKEMGYLVGFYVETIGEASKDSNINYNDWIMKNLPSPFFGEFYGGLADQDGSLGWGKPIIANNVISNSEFRTGEIQREIPARQMIPLEVGYTKSYTTWLHLMGERCLARFPYGYDRIMAWFLIEEVSSILNPKPDLMHEYDKFRAQENVRKLG